MSVQQSTQEQAMLQDLVGRCLRGEQQAFESLYSAIAPSVYRLAYSILLHRQDAEDVVQETMVYAFRNLHRYDPARGNFRAWLYTITVSRCRNARRRKWLPMLNLHALLNTRAEPAEADDYSPETAFARLTTRESLDKALAQLSTRLREAVALRYGHGLTYREMADILGCPQKTAESRVRLAHEALREAMLDLEPSLLEEIGSI